MKQLVVVILGLLFVPAGWAQQVIKLRSNEVKYDITPQLQTVISSESADESRIALVIGNKSYRTGPLTNTVNDANDLADLLTRKNFEVIKIIDGTRLEIRDAVRKFATKISVGSVGLFYYAGHGVQVAGENYLVPVDAKIDYAEDVPEECVAVSSILRYMEVSNNKVNILILDACRNNPFTSFSRSGDKGMLRMEAPLGSIVAYSTAPGMTASDGTGRNGLYTSKLMKYLDVPGLKIEEVFKQVRIEVSRESNNTQIPWENNSLMTDFYFSSK